eukprot:COSAG02_NODE_2131_length_9725_cov_239.696343_5_plen_150_part_00
MADNPFASLGGSDVSSEEEVEPEPVSGSAMWASRAQPARRCQRPLARSVDARATAPRACELVMACLLLTFSLLCRCCRCLSSGSGLQEGRAEAKDCRRQVRRRRSTIRGRGVLGGRGAPVQPQGVRGSESCGEGGTPHTDQVRRPHCHC